MSHIPLQRVIVRMLYDATFRSQVYTDATLALAGVDVSADEASWLTALDPRAYATDPHVRGRSLHGLLSEYSVSGAVANRASVNLDAFFSSAPFHQCIQRGHSLALTFGTWLVDATATGGDRGALAQIEAAMASLRRGVDATPDAELTLGPNLRLVSIAAGALDHYQAALTGMQAQNVDPATAALDTRYPVPVVSLDEAVSEIVLLESTPTGIGAEVLPEGLADILQQASVGTTRAALLMTLHEHDVDVAESKEIVDGLIHDGLLRRS